MLYIPQERPLKVIVTYESRCFLEWESQNNLLKKSIRFPILKLLNYNSLNTWIQL